MKFITLATFLATAMAMPGGAPTSIDQNLNQGTCNKAELSCCDSIDASSSVTQEEKASLLDLLGDNALSLDGILGKFSGCSSLANVNALIGADGKGLLAGQCNNHVACCNGGDNDINGLVNVAIPCIPINVA